MPAVVPADAEKVITDRVKEIIDAGLLPAPPEGKVWARRTVIDSGVTPTWTIQVRVVGGTPEQVVADRPLVDLRIWADGTAATDATRSRAARVLLAHLRRRLPCRIFAAPVPLPDPADTSKVHTLFTIQPLIRGEQLS